MMLLQRLLHMIGAVVVGVGGAMLAPIATSLIYQEWREAALIAAACVVTTVVGWVIWSRFERPRDLSMKEGFAVVGLTERFDETLLRACEKVSRTWE